MQDLKQAIEVLEEYYKNTSPFIRESKVGDSLKSAISLMKELEKKGKVTLDFFANK